MDLSKYRLINYDWFPVYYEKIGHEEFWTYVQKVYKSLENLHPMQHYNIINSISEDMQELFIKIGCMYILDFGGCEACGIQFSDDYTKIMRFKTYTLS